LPSQCGARAARSREHKMGGQRAPKILGGGRGTLLPQPYEPDVAACHWARTDLPRGGGWAQLQYEVIGPSSHSRAVQHRLKSGGQPITNPGRCRTDPGVARCCVKSRTLARLKQLPLVVCNSLVRLVFKTAQEERTHRVRVSPSSSPAPPREHEPVWRRQAQRVVRRW